MNRQTMYATVFLGIFLVLVLFSHILYRYFNWPSEKSRKFLHVSGGLLALTCPLVFESHWWVLVLCILSFIFLFYTYKRKLLPSVHQTARRSIGSVIFPLPVYICFLAAEESRDDLLFYLPVSFLVISDTVAELTGKKWGRHNKYILYNQKTLAGTVSFAICSIFLSLLWSSLFNYTVDQVFWISIVTSVAAALTEMISSRGLDNVTVPMIALACLYILRMLNKI